MVRTVQAEPPGPGPGAAPPPDGGAPPPPGAWSPPPGPPPPGYPPAAQRRTNPLAIVSLVAGLVQFVCLFVVGAVTAIVTGHLARRAIRRSGGAEGGDGLALAGLVLGYVGVALAVAATLVIAVFADDAVRFAMRDDADRFVEEASEIAIRSGETIRDAEVLHAASIEVFDDAFYDVTLPDGTPIGLATDSDWERARWRIEMHTGGVGGIGAATVCAQIPLRYGTEAITSDGPCERGSPV